MDFVDWCSCQSKYIQILIIENVQLEILQKGPESSEISVFKMI